MQKIIPLHTLSILGSLTHAAQGMEIVCTKGWITFKARAIKMSRKFIVGPPKIPRTCTSVPPQNPPSLPRQKHGRRGRDAPYIQARRREGHEEEYKEDEIK
jgi:hypothetical protein